MNNGSKGEGRWGLGGITEGPAPSKGLAAGMATPRECSESLSAECPKYRQKHLE